MFLATVGLTDEEVDSSSVDDILLVRLLVLHVTPSLCHATLQADMVLVNSLREIRSISFCAMANIR